ncbi:resolvase [Methanofollis aquaemaris]|uniref:Resolvase n=1 Tax=Methanofollis aquaemaris TaxID=126734 RepID=A0A8A3S5W8_9EURY|nr:helix-turn-helix domain-containing protein [Methanofollis aquaemaris]QSZ67535.1 resolvase [Methanofollis aquaemaris]
MKKDAVAYFSTRKRGDMEHHRAIVEEFCKYKFSINRVFTDHRVNSAPPRKREGYVEMLTYCQKHGIKHVLFLNLPSVSRNLDIGLEELKLLLSEEIIPYFAEDDFIANTDDSSARVRDFKNFLAYMNAYREFARKNLPNHARPASQPKGTIGRPRALNDGQIEALITVRRSGISISQICRMFNVSRSTVSKILADYPELKGEWKGAQSSSVAKSE